MHIFACGALRLVKGIRSTKLSEVVLVKRLVAFCKATTLTNNGICIGGLCDASLTDPQCNVFYGIILVVRRPRCHLANPARTVPATDAYVFTFYTTTRLAFLKFRNA